MQYWDIVETGFLESVVEYGNDIDTASQGFNGFPLSETGRSINHPHNRTKKAKSENDDDDDPQNQYGSPEVSGAKRGGRRVGGRRGGVGATTHIYVYSLHTFINVPFHFTHTILQFFLPKLIPNSISQFPQFNFFI